MLAYFIHKRWTVSYCICVRIICINLLYYSQLKSREADKQRLRDQVTLLQEDLASCSQEVVFLTEKLSRYKKKYADKTRHTANKLSSSQ